MTLGESRQVRSEAAPLATGRLGMRLLLLSLGMLFAATLAGYFWVRASAEAWPPAGMPALPPGLWLSTALIVVSSVTVQWALAGVRRGAQGALRTGLLLTTLLGLGFLASQTVNWFSLVAANFTPRLNLYAFTFFLLTALHAAHVIGGLIPLAVVTTRAWQGRYGAVTHAGVEYVTTYWHFLGAVWLVLFVVLFLAG